MLNKKAYLAVQAILISLLTPLLNKLCSLHSWIQEYSLAIPGIAFGISYCICTFLPRFSFKSLEQVIAENAQKSFIKKIDERLKNKELSEEKRQELIELKEDVYNKELDMYRINVDASMKELESTLYQNKD
ncbi:hypothetical protein J3U57_06145 [Gilliamella sp. B3464]|uniref:hypothetical protein n=1 Tax=unclassified Gilliamella TaxID=2685620 RepID=UPI00226AF3FC|nr:MULTISPECIES: hypothetical protein [unclassified Gilliamella]MCX8712307.1 hypothetical protein [Gilliamella sp. B3468]MCX8751147.1 hypothetical protein [Gilliamella sp. B3464]